MRGRKIKKKQRSVVGVLGRKTTGYRRDGKTKEAKRNDKALVNLLTCH